jgi:TonB-linked SusC/RagA family outer membrane protein
MNRTYSLNKKGDGAEFNVFPPNVLKNFIRMNYLKKLFLFVVLFCSMLNFNMASAQSDSDFEISGTVTDPTGEPMIGVNIAVKNQPGFGVITDVNGEFSINTDPYNVLVVSFIGFETQEIPIRDRSQIDIVLEETVTGLEEVTIVGAGTQRKVSVTGAITSVDVPSLKVPSSSISNSLAGNVAGIISRQTSGEPGRNNSEFWIRGISTFGASSSALILVDGIERNFNELNVEDIQSFSVLKDASATAIYGQRGANGVVVITTKRGEEGKVNFNFKSEYGVSTPSRMPEYVGGETYAELAFEARI